MSSAGNQRLIRGRSDTRTRVAGAARNPEVDHEQKFLPCDRIIALIDACLADIDRVAGSLGDARTAVPATRTIRLVSTARALPPLALTERKPPMNSTLTEMLATAHRDELRRQASRHSVARQARRHDPTRNTPGTPTSRLLSLRFTGRRSEVRPAAAV